MGEYLNYQYWFTDQSKYKNSIEELNDLEKKIRINKRKNFNIKH